MVLNAYLTFDGNCREAFEFYRSVFGGEFTACEPFSAGAPHVQVSEAEQDWIMHVSLPVGSSVLMGSDVAGGFGPPFAAGNNFSISVQAESREQCDGLIAKLSEGGRVTMPMADAFWGSYFGMCTDRFGISWMFSGPPASS